MNAIKKFFIGIAQSQVFNWLFKVGRDSALSYMASTGFAPTKAWAVGLGVAVVSGIVHGFEGWLNSQTKNTIASNQATAPKIGMVLFLIAGFFALATSAFAQTVNQQKFDLNPNFVGPAQFVQTNNGWMLLPNAGLSVSAVWENLQVVTANGISAQNLLWSVGLCFEENFGMAANAQTVNNAVLGLCGDWKGYNGVIGFQIMGPSLGGPGSSGLVIGASYNL